MGSVVFAPGAGAGCSSPWMEGWAKRMAVLGEVYRFDYPYRLAGRGRPDPLPRLIEAHRAALAAVGPREAVLVGKSMGSRVGCHVSLEVPVRRLVCFGYPLFGQGDPKKRRDAVLLQLRTPILFVQGTRDPLCPLEALEEVRSRMVAPSELFVVESGDHSLEITRSWSKTAGVGQEEVDARILAAITAFVQ